MTEFDSAMLRDTRALRTAFGSFMTGVTVVTTMDGDTPVGFTANSFSSVSLDPPLVSICLANTSQNFDTFAGAEKFAVNVLSEAQIDISNTFAKPVENRFAQVTWQAGPHGSPILQDVAAWFDCAMHQTVQAGDHLIMIGEVKGFAHTIAPGLGYARGAYVTPAAEAEALSRRGELVLSAVVARGGEVLLLEEDGLALPSVRKGKGGVTDALAGLFDGLGVKAEPGFVYAVYEDAQEQQNIAVLCQAAMGAPSRGAFMRLTDPVLDRISDPASRFMLQRYAEESRIGTLGVYYGTGSGGMVTTGGRS